MVQLQLNPSAGQHSPTAVLHNRLGYSAIAPLSSHARKKHKSMTHSELVLMVPREEGARQGAAVVNVWVAEYLEYLCRLHLVVLTHLWEKVDQRFEWKMVD